MIDFLILFFAILLSPFALWGVIYAISLSCIKAKCRRLEREFGQAIADAEKRIRDRDNREKDRP